MKTLPAYFVSHGAPTMVMDEIPGHFFLKDWGRDLVAEFGPPKAIVVVSAHWEEARITVSGARAPETIHDFYGFPEPLYRLRYPAPGAPALAAEIATLIGAAGLPCQTDEARGLDHGAWCPLMLGFPDADIPVVQVSLQHGAGARLHWQLGAALRPLRERGILVLGSGSMTHNLRAFFLNLQRGGGGRGVVPWVSAFTDWIAARIGTGAVDELLAWDERAPHGIDNHPSDEHFMPIFFALGAATPGRAGQRIHASVEGGVLALDAYRFD